MRSSARIGAISTDDKENAKIIRTNRRINLTSNYKTSPREFPSATSGTNEGRRIMIGDLRALEI